MNLRAVTGLGSVTFVIWYFGVTSWNCLLQVSSVQDTPELLGFLRNTSASHQRHRRAVSGSQGSVGKTLVSFALAFVLSNCGCCAAV